MDTISNLSMAFGTHTCSAEHPLMPLYQATGYHTLSRYGVPWVGVGRFTIQSMPCNGPLVVTKSGIERGLLSTGTTARLAKGCFSIAPANTTAWERHTSWPTALHG